MPDCRLTLPVVSGTDHPYFGASPACWALYGEVLAREYESPALKKVHRLVVQTVPFVPYFLLGIFFLLAPGFAVTAFTNSDAAGGETFLLVALAALVRPTASWMLVCGL